MRNPSPSSVRKGWPPLTMRPFALMKEELPQPRASNPISKQGIERRNRRMDWPFLALQRGKRQTQRSDPFPIRLEPLEKGLPCLAQGQPPIRSGLVIGHNYLAVVLGLQDAPGILVDGVRDKLDAAVREAGVDAARMQTARHGRIHLVTHRRWRRGGRARETAQAGPVTEAGVPELPAILELVGVGLASGAIQRVIGRGVIVAGGVGT